MTQMSTYFHISEYKYILDIHFGPRGVSMLSNLEIALGMPNIATYLTMKNWPCRYPTPASVHRLVDFRKFKSNNIAVKYM